VTLPDRDGTVAMVDAETHTGAHAFTSTTRPTSAGTGTPASTSLITRDDGDTRFARKATTLVLQSNFDSDQNTTTYKTVTGLTSGTLPSGNYYIEAYLIHNGNTNYATSGVKDQITAISGTVSPTPVGNLIRVFDNATGSSTYPNGRASGNPFLESSPTNRSQSTLRTGYFTVTVDAVIAVQIAQTTAVAASNTTLVAGSYLRIMPIT
jgi:hypothetical protein